MICSKIKCLKLNCCQFPKSKCISWFVLHVHLFRIDFIESESDSPKAKKKKKTTKKLNENNRLRCMHKWKRLNSWQKKKPTNQPAIDWTDNTFHGILREKKRRTQLEEKKKYTHSNEHKSKKHSNRRSWLQFVSFIFANRCVKINVCANQIQFKCYL